MGLFSLFDLCPDYPQYNVSFDLTIPQPIQPTISRRVTQQYYPSRIPIEIILNIMDAAYDEHDIEATKGVLRSFALVCRDWSLPAQKLLFRHVALKSQADCLSFESATDRSTKRGRVLGNTVRTMRATLDPNQPFGLSQLSFAHAFSLCPNLYELNLALYGCVSPGNDVVGSPDASRMRRPASSFDEDTLALLRSGPSISTLRFSNWSENRQSITQLLGVWTTLKTIVMSGTAPELPSPVSEPFPCSLDELRINFQTAPSIDFLRWLLHNSSDTLRSLEFERDPSASVLNYLIDSHHATLRALSLPNFSRGITRVLEKCASLRRFSVEDANLSPVALKKLSPHVEHIGFGMNKESSLQLVLDTIKTKESLKAVTVNLWNGGKLHRQLPALKMACAVRGIDLRVTHDIRTFRSIRRGNMA